MSDSLETDALEAGTAPSQTQVGAILKDAREQRNMTVEDVCTHLRISPHQVKALESDEFSSLPEAMITRGFIRNYARLLEIDAEPLLQAYRTFVPTEAPRALTLKSENILITGKEKQPWLKYILASMVIALSLGVWQFYMDYTPRPPAQQAALPINDIDATEVSTIAETSASAETGPEGTVMEQLPVPALPAAERASAEEELVALAQAGTTPGITSTVAETATPGIANQQLPVDAKTATVKPKARLKLTFSKTSWVNVTDHSKKMIFDRIMPAGSEETIEGEPPFEVVIGNAPGSKLVFNDKSVDLAPYTKSNVARVTLE